VEEALKWSLSSYMYFIMSFAWCLVLMIFGHSYLWRISFIFRNYDPWYKLILYCRLHSVAHGIVVGCVFSLGTNKFARCIISTWSPPVLF